MVWDNIVYVWDQLLAFFDRAFQWLRYLFTDEPTWDPDDYPTITD